MGAAMRAFLGNVLREGTQESFGRVVGAVFLTGSFCLSMADGIMSLVHGASALDAAASLAVTGWSLFTMSKVLHIKGKKLTASGGAAAPAETPTEESA